MQYVSFLLEIIPLLFMMASGNICDFSFMSLERKVYNCWFGEFSQNGI